MDPSLISRRDFISAGIGAGLGLSLFNLENGWGMASSVEIIVIGAGIAGLTAARTLVDRGHSVIVLEARDRTGGRIWTDRTFNSGPIDLGASWLHGHKQNPLFSLIQKSNISTVATDNETRPETYHPGGKLFTKDERHKIDSTFESILEDVTQKQEALTGGQDRSLGEAFDEILKNISLTENERREQRHLIATEVENDYATDCTELSLRHWNKYRHFSGDELLFLGGYVQVIDALAKGVDVRLKQVVTNVDYGGSKIKVSTSNGETWTGDKVIVALPLGVLKGGAVSFSPPLPQPKRKAIQAVGVGAFHKIYLQFEKPFWPIRSTWIECLGENPKQWSMFLNFMKYSGRPILVAFNVGRFAEELEKKEEREVVQAATANLRSFFGKGTLDPVASKVTTWSSDPFSRGAYSYIRKNCDSADLDMLGKPVGSSLFFAGEATSSQDYATVHAAYLSGLRAAKQITDLH